MLYFLGKKPATISIELNYNYQEEIGYQTTRTIVFEPGQCQKIKKIQLSLPINSELQLIQISAEPGANLNVNELGNILSLLVPEKIISDLDLSGLPLAGKFADLLKKLIDLRIRVEHLNASNTGLTDNDLLATIANMTNKVIISKQYGCTFSHKINYEPICIEHPNFSTINISNNHLGYDGFFCLRLLQLNALFTKQIDISGNNSLGQKPPNIKESASPCDYYTMLGDIYEYSKHGYFFSSKPNLYPVYSRLLEHLPDTDIIMDLKQSNIGIGSFIQNHLPVKTPLANTLNAGVESSNALVSKQKDSVDNLAIIEQVLKSPTITIEGLHHYKRLIILADTVEISAEACIDFDFLAIMANTIIIKGKLQGNSGALLQIKAHSQLIIEQTASLAISNINIITCHFYHYGNSEMTTGKWQVAGLFVHGSLLTPSSIAAKHLDITASIYLQSPVACLLSTGNSISWLALNAGLTMARTNYALLNASLFANIPLLANVMQSPNTIYQLIPMISELLSNVFYIKNQPDLLASLSSQALLQVFRGVLTIVSAAHPHVFGGAMLLNIMLQIPVLAKGFYDCYQRIQQQKPLQLLNNDSNDYIQALAVFNNERPYETFLMAMELSSQTASLIVQGIRTRYLFSQYWSDLQQNALSLKTLDITSYVQEKFKQLSSIELNHITAALASLMPFGNVMSLLSINNLVTLLPEHETIAALDVSLLSMKLLANTRTTAGLQMSMGCVSQLSRENSQTFAKITFKSHLSLSNSIIKNSYHISNSSSSTFLGQNSIETTHLIHDEHSGINGESLHLSYQNGNLANTQVGIKNLSIKTNNEMPTEMINQMLERSGEYQFFCPDHLKLDFNGDYHHTALSLSNGYKLINICANLASIDTTINAADTRFIIQSKIDNIYFNELVTAKSMVAISNKDIYLADKDNGLLSHLANANDPEFLQRQATLNAQTIHLQAKNTIVNKGSALSTGRFSIIAGNLVDNYGYLTASEGMLSVEAKTVHNHHASKEEKDKHHKKTFTLVKASISGGWGSDGQTIGLAISADTIINDAATLSAKGLVRGFAKNGIENRTVTWQPDATKKHHGRRTYPQTQLYRGTVVSGQEDRANFDPQQIAIIIHSDGTYLDQSGDYIAFNGGKICLSSHEPIQFETVTMTYGAKKSTKKCFSKTTITERHHVEMPAVFHTDKVLLMSDKSLQGVLPMIIENDPAQKHLALISPTIELRTGKHHVTKKIRQSGLQATFTLLGMIGINIIKQPQQESILDVKTLLNGFDELFRSKNLLDASKALYALGLAYPDAAKAAYNTLWYGDSFEYDKLLPKLTYPQLQVIFSRTEQSISVTQKGFGSIDTHDLTIIAELKCELQGIDVNAQKAYIKTPLFVHSGEPYTQTAKSQSKQVSVSSSKHFGVTKRSEKNSQQGRTPAVMNIHQLDADIGEWQAIATHTNIEESSGHIGHVSFSNDSTVVERKSHYVTAASNTLLGAEHAHVREASCQPSRFEINSSSGMRIGSVVNSASFFKSSGVTIGQYDEIPYQRPIQTKHKTTGFLTTLTAWRNPDINAVSKIQGLGASFTFLTPHFFAAVTVSAPIENHSLVDEVIDVVKPEKPVKKRSAPPSKKTTKANMTAEKAQEVFNTIVHEEYTKKMNTLEKWGIKISAGKIKKNLLKTASKAGKSLVSAVGSSALKVLSGESAEIDTEFFVEVAIEFASTYLSLSVKSFKYMVKIPDTIHAFYKDFFDEEMIDRHLAAWHDLEKKGFYWGNNRELSQKYYLFLQYQKNYINGQNYFYDNTYGPLKNVVNKTITPAIKTTVVEHIEQPQRFAHDILEVGFAIIPTNHPFVTPEVKQQIRNDWQRSRDKSAAEKQKKASIKKEEPTLRDIIVKNVNEFEKNITRNYQEVKKSIADQAERIEHSEFFNSDVIRQGILISSVNSSFFVPQEVYDETHQIQDKRVYESKLK